ncbi:MAG TPA: hypothetical protein VGI81_27860 [Tepidisphaeraceae bacterium]|jgi:ABC-type transporter Mla MlaB component
MLRITEISEANAVTLKLAGKLVGPWIGELRSACGRAAARYGTVRLDLADVSFVDADGIALIRELAGGGLAIARTNPFVAELLMTEKP